MLPLQSNIPNADADSLRIAADTMFRNMTEDPNTFFYNLGQNAIQFGIKIIAALCILFVGIWLIRWVKRILRRSFERRKVELAVASFISSITSVLLTIILVVITISTLGINTTSIAAILAAGGVAVGASLSGALQNFAGGLLILIFKQFKAGDYISAQGSAGTVIDINMLNTRIRTIDNRVIVIPNGALISGTIDNYSVNPLRRVEWNVNVQYESDLDICISTLHAILKSDARVLDATTEGASDVTVELNSLNHDDISFQVRAWVKTEDYWNVYYAVNREIYVKLPQAGISFASKRLDVTVKQAD